MAGLTGFTKDPLTKSNDQLWGAKKTYYDPCPPGWHVSDWSYETWRDFRDKSSWVSHGRLYGEVFVPASGYIYGFPYRG